MIKMRCPNKNSISDCSNESNSRRGTDFKKDVLDKNNWEMESVCAGYIREPRYFKQGKVGDKALCALTNPQGKALYKVIIPMEYRYAAPLKKLDGTTISYKPKEIKVDMNDAKSVESIFMSDKTLMSMSGTPAELLAIATRCTSRVYSALDMSGANQQVIDQNKKITTQRISKWVETKGLKVPGTQSSNEDNLLKLASYHQKKHGNDKGDTGLDADTKSCIPIYQQTGLY